MDFQIMMSTKREPKRNWPNLEIVVDDLWTPIYTISKNFSLSFRLVSSTQYEIIQA